MIGELKYKEKVLNVILKADRIVAVLENRIYVYNFSNLKLI